MALRLRPIARPGCDDCSLPAEYELDDPARDTGFTHIGRFCRLCGERRLNRSRPIRVLPRSIASPTVSQLDRRPPETTAEDHLRPDPFKLRG